MSSVNQPIISCPQCGNPTRVNHHLKVLDLGHDPELARRFLEGEFNFLDCPQCGAESFIPFPLAINDPKNSELIIFIAEDPNLDRGRLNQIIQYLGQTVLDSISGNPPSYIFEPILIRDPEYLAQLLIEKMSDDNDLSIENPNVAREMLDLILVHMTPENATLFRELAAKSNSEEDFLKELTDNPKLDAAWKKAQSDFVHTNSMREVSESNPDFVSILTEMGNLSQMTDMPCRLSLCRQILAMIDREQHPELWAEFQSILGDSLAQTPQGNRKNNLELAIEAYEKALAVQNPEYLPIKWGDTQLNMANVYAMRIEGDRAKNIEMAIYHCQQALQVFTRQAFPDRWARAQNNLANMYRNRIKGARAENIEQAITYFQQALYHFGEEDFPEDWATIQNNLAIAYRDRIKGSLSENIEMAIHHYQLALKVRTIEKLPTESAMTHSNLAGAFSALPTRNQTENINQAIFHAEQDCEFLQRKIFQNNGL